VKLLDFGIAKARNSLERTRVGTVKGTAGYMSPEQVRGQPLDGRSDVYTAGVVLWELVTGERLFAGETEREEMTKILEAPIVSPRHRVSGVSEELSAVILRALERNPGARWQSAKELARALEASSGELMFDGDQRAALMRQLFEQKMVATRALLETADPSVSGAAEAVPWRPEREEPEPVLRGGTQVLEEKAPSEKKAPGESKGRGKKKAASKPVDEEAKAAQRAPTTQVSAPPVEMSSSSGRGLSLLLWGVMALGIASGVGFLVLNERTGQGLGPPPAEPAGPLPAFVPQLKVFPEPGQPAGTAGAALDGGTAGSGTEVANGKAGPGEEPEDGDEDKPGKSRVAQGKMTLIIHPEAEVLLGKKSLGKTPLFNTTLPVGTHLLRIVGPDGKRRQLSVPIKRGETTKLRFGLDDIPERR
jgi:serine/threonine-protein kinase